MTMASVKGRPLRTVEGAAIHGKGTITALPAIRAKRSRRTYNGIVLDVHTVAALLGTTSRAIRGLMARRTIPYRKYGNRIIFLRIEVEEFLANLPGCRPDEVEQNLALRQGER